MFFAEPPRSPYDVYFSIFGIRVRVHPWFWLVGALLGLNARSLSGVLIWIAALFVAILVHELGHALVMRRFGLRPWITLYGMGGLASYDPSRLAFSGANTWIRQILISAAGATAGFLLAIVLITVFVVLGHQLVILVGVNTGRIVSIGLTGIDSWVNPGLDFSGILLAIGGIRVEILGRFVNHLLHICLIWGLVNLLPVYPLDGGHISRELFLRFSSREGIRRSLILSTATAGLLAAVALATVLRDARLIDEAGGSPGSAFRSASTFVAVLFGYLAYSSYATLRAYDGTRRGW